MFQFNFQSFSLAFLVLVCGNMAAIAQTETTDEPSENYDFEFTIIDEILNQTIYAPFRQEATLKESSRPAYVIDREQIEAQGYRTVNEALKYLPGVYSDGTSAGNELGAVSSQILRGGNKTSQTLILLDGRPINQQGFFGEFDLSGIAVGNLERIEVIPGGSSTLFGSTAIGGVINIVTRPPEFDQKTAVQTSLDLGNFGFNQQALSLQHGTDKLAFNFGYNRIASENDFPYNLEKFSGTRDNAAANIQNLNFQVSGKIGDRHQVKLSSLYGAKEIGIPSSLSFPTPKASQYTEDWLFSLDWQARLGNAEDSTLTAKVFADFNDYYSDFPEYKSNDEVNNRSIGTQIQHNWQLNTTQNLVYGFDYRHANTNNTSSGKENYNKEINQGAFFARYAVDLTPELSANFGLRQDFNNLTNGSVTSPSAGFLLKATDSTTIRANYARNFRVPSGMDLYYPGFSNPNLTPEISNSFDVGIDQNFFNRALLRLTYFTNTIDDAIVLDQTFTPFNIGKTRNQGLEAELTMQFAKNIYGFVNYTLNNSEILEDANQAILGNEVRFAGTDYLNMGLAYQNPQGLYLGLFLKNIGDRFTNNNNTNTLPSYANVDIRARYPINKTVNLTASWENIFDNDYETAPGYPGIGSRIQVGLNAKF